MDGSRLKFQTKRIYEAPKASDGVRILIDRLWPRGVSKERAAIDYWARDLAPSADLRRWYAHDPEKWETFQKRYFAEIEANPAALDGLRQTLSAKQQNTIVFASKETERNNASALVLYLRSH